MFIQITFPIIYDYFDMFFLSLPFSLFKQSFRSSTVIEMFERNEKLFAVTSNYIISLIIYTFYLYRKCALRETGT